jgi:hypothetical protein
MRKVVAEFEALPAEATKGVSINPKIPKQMLQQIAEVAGGWKNTKISRIKRLHVSIGAPCFKHNLSYAILYSPVVSYLCLSFL